MCGQMCGEAPDKNSSLAGSGAGAHDEWKGGLLKPVSIKI